MSFFSAKFWFTNICRLHGDSVYIYLQASSVAELRNNARSRGLVQKANKGVEILVPELS